MLSLAHIFDQIFDKMASGLDWIDCRVLEFFSSRSGLKDAIFEAGQTEVVYQAIMKACKEGVSCDKFIFRNSVLIQLLNCDRDSNSFFCDVFCHFFF